MHGQDEDRRLQALGPSGFEHLKGTPVGQVVVEDQDVDRLLFEDHGGLGDARAGLHDFHASVVVQDGGESLGDHRVVVHECDTDRIAHRQESPSGRCGR